MYVQYRCRLDHAAEVSNSSRTKLRGGPRLIPCVGVPLAINNKICCVFPYECIQEPGSFLGSYTLAGRKNSFEGSPMGSRDGKHTLELYRYDQQNRVRGVQNSFSINLTMCVCVFTHTLCGTLQVAFLGS